MKILHTAEWRLGMAFPQQHRVAEDLRRARLQAVNTLLELARTERVDAVVVTGGVFEDNQVGRATLDELSRILNRHPGKVHLLPGRRDPLLEHSPYRLFPEVFPEQVSVGEEPDLPEGYSLRAEVGPPEPADYGQEGSVNLVEWRGGQVHLQRRSTGRYRWLNVGSLTELEEVPNPRDVLVRLEFLPPCEVEARFFHVWARDMSLPTVSRPRDPVLRRVVDSLQVRLSGEDAGTARLALRFLESQVNSPWRS